MQKITWNDAWPIFLFCVTALLCWKLFIWMRRGEIRLYPDGGPTEVVPRAQQPIKFWLYFVLYVCFVGFMAWFFGRTWLELFGRISN
jgi:hypothetical protein